jgi:amino acid adenylation domain-containing protein
MGAYAHQEAPFEKVVEEMQPERDLSRNPLFQVFFNMLNLFHSPESRLHLPGISVEYLPSPEVGSKFDLTLYVSEDNGEIPFSLVYNAELFKPARMQEMLEQLKYLLSQVVQNPRAKISEYSLATPSSKTFLPDPAVPLDAHWEGAIADLFALQAKRRAETIAVKDACAAWSYQELDARSNQLANCLCASGIQRGDIVAIYGHRSIPLVWALLGVLKSGAAFLILDPAYPAARLIDYLKSAKPQGLIEIEAAGTLSGELGDFLETMPCRCRLKLPVVSNEVIEDPLPDHSTNNPDVKLTADDLAYVSFTSGSTGKPKGVLGRQGPLTHFVPWLKETFGLDESDRFSLLSGLSHDPLHRDIFTPLQLGATICIPPPAEMHAVGRLAEWMKEEKISIAHLTPAMAQVLTDRTSNGATDELKVDSLRYAFIVGDVLTKRDVSRLQETAPNLTCINFYGATETQRAVSYFVVPNERLGEISTYEKEVLPLGRGIKDVQLLVLNPSMKLAGVGEIGEIYFRSPHLAQGYMNDERLTRERFLLNPFANADASRLYKTGDLGRYSPDGNVEIVGRADRQVKIRGFRIELGEIEATLAACPGVREAVVIAKQDGKRERRLIAYVVCAGESAPSSIELRRYLKGKLPDYMVPSAFVLLERLPLTPNGKVDRQALPEPADPSLQMREAVAGILTPIQEIISNIWREVLVSEAIGPQDDFFALGGNSLHAMQAVARIRESLRVRLPLRRLFEFSTVAGLAAKVSEALQNEAGLQLQPILPVPRNDPLPLSFSQQRLWLMNQIEPGNPAYIIPRRINLSGKLDVRALGRSLDEVVRRHEVLRTRFVIIDSIPQQLVSPHTPLPLPLIDLQELDRTTQERAITDFNAWQARQRFDLERGPLLRCLLLRLSADEHVFLLTTHHIVSDGWSMAIMMRELTRLYEAFSLGRTPQLDPLPIQYADYAVWQRQQLRGERLDQQLRYWREQLKGIKEAINLPTDRLRPAVQSYRGASLQVRIGERESHSLRKEAQRQGVTLYMALVAAFKVLLWRMSGGEEVVVGTAVANRERVEVEGLIGFFVNTVALRSELRGEMSYEEVVRGVREVCMGAYAHQEAPFEKVVEEMQPERDLSRNPLFQVMFILQNAPRVAFEFPGLRVSSVDVETNTAKFELKLNLVDWPEGISGFLEFNTEIFEPASIADMIEDFHSIIRQVIAQPKIKLNDLDRLLAEEDEKRQLRSQQNLQAKRQQLLETQKRKPVQIQVQ